MSTNLTSVLIAACGLASLTSMSCAGLMAHSYKLTAADGGPAHEFGQAVDFSAGVIAIGAPHADGLSPDSGSVYLYNAATGVLLHQLAASDGASGDRFGFSVAIRGGVVVVGAVGDERNGVTSGSAYLFDVATGAQLAVLAPGDGAAGDEFGFAVATDGDVVVVGAKRDDDHGQDSGSVYVFDAATGAALNKIVPADGAANDNFGGAVAIDGGVIAVGARGDWDNGPLSGSAYLFDAATGSQLFKLLASNGQSSDFFGSAIDVDGGLVLVGAWAKSIFFDHSGAAYVFDASTGTELRVIVPADGHDRDHFGISVSISDGVAAIGAHQDGDSGFNAGSAYLYDATSGALVSKLLAPDGEAFDLFGTAVAIDQGMVAVGAIGDQDQGADSGSVRVFGHCRGDATGDGAIDFDDLNEVLSNWNTTSGSGDVNGDGTTNFDDLNEVLLHWSQGC